MTGNMRKGEIPEELSLDQSWCLGEMTFCLLLKELQSLVFENLVEFGSGISSGRLRSRAGALIRLEISHSR